MCLDLDPDSASVSSFLLICILRDNRSCLMLGWVSHSLATPGLSMNSNLGWSPLLDVVGMWGVNWWMKIWGVCVSCTRLFPSTFQISTHKKRPTDSVPTARRRLWSFFDL